MLLAQGAGPMRLGRHMVLSGKPSDALGTLLHGADIAWSRGEYGRAAELLALREHALEQSQIKADQPAWGQGWIRRARLAMRHGDIALGRSLLDQTEQAARRHSWDAELSETLASQSAHYSFTGEHSKARHKAEEAVSLAESSGDLVLVARSYRALGQRLVERGDFDRAEQMIKHSSEIFEAFEDEVGVIQCDQVLFLIARGRGQLTEARAILLHLVEVQERRGYRWGLAAAVNGLGDIARTEGKLSEAEAHYRRAAALFISVSPTAPTARSVSVNLALVLVAQDRFDEAAELLSDAIEAIDTGSSTANRGLSRMVLACCAAGAGRWEAFDTPFLRGLSLLTRIERLDIDVAGVAERIGHIALRAGQPERAERALGLARWQWEGLGRQAELSRVERLLERC
jgi:tetratricopeptide (TPR) repeat protein